MTINIATRTPSSTHMLSRSIEAQAQPAHLSEPEENMVKDQSKTLTNFQVET